MASEWFYTVNGQQAASPATLTQLRQMAQAGQLRPTDLVWQEGMANWAPASTVKGLFGGRDPAAPEVPPAKPRARSKKAEGEGEPELPGGLLALHPLLILLLSVVTFGVFGLVYAYLACGEYSGRFTRRADSSGRPLGVTRHPIGVGLLTILTFGIYFYYWSYKLMCECRAYTGRKDLEPRIEVSLMLIFPPYAIYVVAVRLADLIRAAQAAAKVPESAAVNMAYIFLIPVLYPALPLLAMAQQEALNQVWQQAP